MVTESNERAKELEKRHEVEPEERIGLVDVGRQADEHETITHEEVPGSDVSQERIVDDVTNPASSMQYNGNLLQDGFAAAEELTPENVGDLELEYVINTGSAGLQTNPIIVPGDDGEPPVMYYTQGNMVVGAVNARTGEPFWEFHYSTQRGFGQGEKNRGVSVWEDKVYFGPHDTFLLALNRYTGELEWTTDLLTDGQKEMPIGDERVSHTAAPLVYDGTVFIGQSGDMIGWTTISGVDAESGEIQWQYKTGPEDEWVGETWKYASGAAWMGPTVDPETGLAFYVTGNPMPVANGVVRPGPNKHTNSIIAVDVESGDIEWTHQLYPHEVWDYDGHTQAYVFDMEVDGETRRVVGHDSKTAWTFVLDAETGQLLRRSDPWETQEHEFGAWPDSRFLNYPPKGEENAGRMAPHFAGATEWPGDAYSRNTGLRYINSNGSQTGYFYTDWEFDPEEASFLQSGGTTDPGEYDAELRVIGLDPERGTVESEYVFDDADGKVWGPGVRATAGEVVFSGSPEGAFVALDDENLEELWRYDTEGRITASPVVWDDPEIGQGFVTVASDDRIFVFTTETSEDAPREYDFPEREEEETPEDVEEEDREEREREEEGDEEDEDEDEENDSEMRL
ncbi:PQQ-binding-like beta-propeller repeat protein [Saliphagus sp. GCM10025334]